MGLLFMAGISRTHQTQLLNAFEIELITADDFLKQQEQPAEEEKDVEPPPPAKPMRVQPARPARPVPQIAPALQAADTPGDDGPNDAQETLQSASSAPPAESRPAGTALASHVPSLPRDTIMQGYASTLWQRILRFRPNNLTSEGIVAITFTLGADGRLISAEIAASSGSSRLDRAALDTVRLAQPFPPRPPELGLGPLTFTIPFRFQTSAS